MSDSSSTFKSKLFCSVVMCRNYNNPYSAVELYKLPKNVSQRRKFSEILGIPITVALADTARVCALHFKSKTLNQKPSPPTAVPNTTIKRIPQIISSTSGGTKVITVIRQTVNPSTSILTSNVASTSISEPPASENSSSNNATCEIRAHTTIVKYDALKPTDMQLELECEDEELSPCQLDAHLQEKAAYITASNLIRCLPHVSPMVTMTSTQTDPVILLDPIPSTQPSISSNIVSGIQNTTSQIENKSQPIVLNPQAMTLLSPATDNASLISPNPVNQNNLFPNSIVLPPNVGLGNLLNLVSIAGNTFITTSISPSTPATTTFSVGDKSKLLTYLQPSSVLPQPTGNFENPTASLLPPARPSLSTPRLQGIGPSIMQPTYIQSVMAPATSLPSASSTLFSFASNHTNQLLKTNSGLALTSVNPQESISQPPYPNQIRFQTKSLQPPSQQSFQLISLNESGGVLTPISQSLDQQIMNEGQHLSTYSSTNFNSNLNPSSLLNKGPNSTSSSIAQEFQNIPKKLDSSYQMLVPMPDNPNFVFSNKITVQGGTSQSILNTQAGTSSQDFITIEDDSDKDDEVLAAMSNVVTIYGSESTASTDSTLTANSAAVEKNQETSQKVVPAEENNSSSEEVDNGSTYCPSPSESTDSDNSTGPLIVDVISATEGGKDYFIGNKIPNILFEPDKQLRKKKEANEKNCFQIRKEIDSKIAKNQLVILKGNKVKGLKIRRTKTYDKKEKSDEQSTSDIVPVTQISQENVAARTLDKEKDVHLLYKNQNGPIQAVKLHNSVFSLQTSIPVIPNGHQQNIDTRTLIEFKIPIGKNGVENATSLRKRLTDEKFTNSAVWWLVRRNYLPMPPPCSCGSCTYNICNSNNFSDGFCWQCVNPKCTLERAIQRPKLFEYFKHLTLEQILLLTYHWACQSSLPDILKDVNIDWDQILKYFRALQNVCYKLILNKCKLGKSANSVVETALVKLGNFFVIGAYDRGNRYTRLEAITQAGAYSTTVHISLLGNWIDNGATLVSDKKINNNLLHGISRMSADPAIKDPSSLKPHILNISQYLVSNLTALFGKVNQNCLPLDVVKGYLYELQWRSKYGKFLDMAFWSIMNHIRDMNDSNNARVYTMVGQLHTECGKGIIIKEGGKGVSKLLGSQGVVSDLFQDVPEILGGCADITSRGLLCIKIRCEDSTPQGVYKPNATSLGLQLRTEGFISDPVKWLVKRGYISGTGSCYVCKGLSLLRQTSKYKDGCSWLCQNQDCKFENMFTRPRFFARFKEQTMAQVAAMIFHWTVQSDFNIITSDVPLDSVQISHAWRSFQVLCSSALKRENYKIGGTGQIVEVALVQFGQLNILGARHRLTKRTFLKCFPFDQVDRFYVTLASWLRPKSLVVANHSSLFSDSKWSDYKIFPADSTVTDKTSTKMHILNVTSYLLKHIYEMFGHLKADSVNQELMQVYLDELMWRERFGKLPNLAFAKIMYEIFYHEKYKSPIFDGKHLVNELLQEDTASSKCEKEVRVVLQRIPPTVLKYYNCLPTDSATPTKLAADVTSTVNLADDSSDSSDEDLMEAVAAAIENESLSDISSSEMDDATNDEKNSQSKKEIKRPTFNDIAATKIKEEPQSPKLKKQESSVQPLVIKRNKNRKNYQSYLKSEFLKAKYKKQRSKSRFKKRKPPHKLKLQRKVPASTALPVIKNNSVAATIKVEPGTSTDNVCASGSRILKKRSVVLKKSEHSGETVCIECSKPHTFDHFMKQFNCTDCKNTVYTTCCSNAFFEHRSALLFGKRMPRRDKVAHGHGLHHTHALAHAAVCSCGFKSKIGNHMASHMVKCQQSTCFYNVL